MRVAVWAAVCLLVAASGHAFALGEPQRVHFSPTPGAFPIAQTGRCTPLLVEASAWPGVTRAAESFAQDVERVSGCKPALLHALPTHGEVIAIATLGRSALLEQLIRRRELQAGEIQGHWESSLTHVIEARERKRPRVLVLAGADKRGTIFALYGISEQMGVSPWYWWADVPVPHHASISIDPQRSVEGEPRVKYRGIFLNDEAPSLTGWAQEKFGGFNHRFYEHVFELILRLRANFLWPAMWNSAFNEDDPLNPRLADEYGVVMGTSHHEPMMRAQQEWKRHGTGPWNYSTNAEELRRFWREGVRRNRHFEELTTIGMRGDGDMAMSPSTDTALLEKVVSDQRRILAEEVNPDVTRIPQVWALYKEVQTYYEKGMRVPDDVTLLWSDDNWGNLRRLPTAEERRRTGGAGIYYHVDYVGGPRSYKWLNTYPIQKISEQMQLALDYGADRLWVLNVGDLKPMEFPIEFFLSMARTPQRWGKDRLDEYTRLWAAREFGQNYADDIAHLVTAYTRYNGRRKPEQLEPATFSLTESNEADRVEQEWKNLVQQADQIASRLAPEFQPAFFELVQYPVKASATVNQMMIAAGRNALYARQGRVSANRYAGETRRLFAQDAELSDQYNHQLLGGRWDHMMDQTHLGYFFWNEPPLNAMPAVTEVQPLPGPQMGFAVEGSSFGKPVLPAFDSANRQQATLTVFNRGLAPFSFKAEASEPWVRLGMPGGTVSTEDIGVTISIRWEDVPVGTHEAHVHLQQIGGASAEIPLTVRKAAASESLEGFVENGNAVSIEASHASMNRPGQRARWELLPGFGETGSAMEAFPDTAPPTTEALVAACLDYRVYLWESGVRSLQTVLAPTLAFAPNRGLRFSVALDQREPITVDAWANSSEKEWETAVSDGVHRITTNLGVVSAGEHTVHLCRVDPGVAVERLVLYWGHAPGEYLGPAESVRLGTRLAAAQ